MPKLKYTIQNAHDIASTKGGKCLSDSLQNTQSKLEWECAKGHIWTAPFHDILYHNNWCLLCYHRQFTIHDMNEIAASRGGKCLSARYINSRTKLKWQCSEKHEWEACPKIITTGSWCPHCRKSIGEHKCRFIFEKLFGIEFKTTKKVLPNKWELDGYNDELKLAFEYNGEQHYHQINKWHRNRNTLMHRQYIDKEKKKACNNKNIKLITISFENSKNDEMLLSFIKEQLSEIGIIAPNDLQNLHEFGAYLKNKKETENLIRQRGGTLLSSSHANKSIRLQIQCESGHQWNADYYSIRKGTWCPVCSHKKIAEQQTKIGRAHV